MDIHIPSLEKQKTIGNFLKSPVYIDIIYPLLTPTFWFLIAQELKERHLKEGPIHR